MQDVFILKQEIELCKEHKRIWDEKLHNLLAPDQQKHKNKYEEINFTFFCVSMGCWFFSIREGTKTLTRTMKAVFLEQLKPVETASEK